jgi:hypothetical protein
VSTQNTTVPIIADKTFFSSVCSQKTKNKKILLFGHPTSMLQLKIFCSKKKLRYGMIV